MFRRCLQDYTVARGTLRSRTIKAGKLVVAAIRSAMRDGREIPAASTFCLDRPPHHYMHFGYGLHSCLGDQVSQVMVPEIVKRLLTLPGLRPAGPIDKRGGPWPEEVPSWNSTYRFPDHDARATLRCSCHTAPPAVEPMSNLPPRYILGDALGHGGMGTVLLAEDTQLGRKVAVKFLSAKLENDPTARERLHREARSAAALDHPYICKIHEIVAIDGRTGIVMEYVRGETLQTRLRRSAFGVAEALTIAGEVAEAMDAAHRRHVIHRDLKPSNIMLAESGHVKVMDFGLAKAISPDGVGGAPETVLPLTEVGLRLGTPRYMSPEQILGQEADARSDIFAFGMLFYELMTSTHPFDDPSSAGTMAAILRDPPKPLAHSRSGLPAFAQHMIDRLLAKDPDRRYQSFREVRADVEQLRRDLPATTVPDNTMPAAPSTDDTRTSVGSSRAPSTTEERRQITVIFCEMDGLGDMSNSVDAEDLLELGEQCPLDLAGSNRAIRRHYGALR